MKAIILTGIRQMELKEIPEPKLKDKTDVLLKIEAVGICGSDVHYYDTGRIGSQIVKFPFIIGHECAATVKAVGAEVRRCKPGDRVVVDPAVPCHRCYQCLKDRENTCYNLRFLGTPGQGDGCLCEYIVMPEECCYPIGPAVTFEQGALCEPLSVAIYSVRRAGIGPNTSTGILGAGPIGLSVLLAAKAQNVNNIFITEKIPARLNAARSAGAAWAGNPDVTDVVGEILAVEPLGLDVVFECCGQQEALDQALDMLKAGGLLVIVGIPRQPRISFDIDKLRRKELTILNIRRQNHCTQPAIELIDSSQANVDFMVTHRFPFEQTQKAFDLVAGYKDGVIKAIVRP